MYLSVRARVESQIPSTCFSQPTLSTIATLFTARPREIPDFPPIIRGETRHVAFNRRDLVECALHLRRYYLRAINERRIHVCQCQTIEP